MSKENSMPIFHSVIAGEMFKQKKNIPHRRSDLYYQTGDSKLQEGFNITSYFPNRRMRRSILSKSHTNQRVRTNSRGVTSRTERLQKVWNGSKQKFINIIHKIFKP